MLAQSHQAKIITQKRLIPARSNMTRVRVEPKSYDQGRNKERRLCSLGRAKDKSFPVENLNNHNILRHDVSCLKNTIARE